MTNESRTTSIAGRRLEINFLASDLFDGVAVALSAGAVGDGEEGVSWPSIPVRGGDAGIVGVMVPVAEEVPVDFASVFVVTLALVVVDPEDKAAIPEDDDAEVGEAVDPAVFFLAKPEWWLASNYEARTCPAHRSYSYLYQTHYTHSSKKCLPKASFQA